MNNGNLIGLFEAIGNSFKQLFKKENFIFYLKAELVRILLGIVVAIPILILFGVTLGSHIMGFFSNMSQFTDLDVENMGQMQYQQEFNFNVESDSEAEIKELMRMYQEGEFDEKDFMIPENVRGLYTGDTELPADMPVQYNGAGFDETAMEAYGEQMVEQMITSMVEDMMPSFLLFMALMIPIGLLVGSFFNVYTVKTSLSVVTGKLPSIGDLIGTSFRLMPKMLVLNVLLALIFIPAFLLFVIPGIVAVVLFMFANFILVHEELGPTKALGTSFKRSKAYFWNLLLKGIGYAFIMGFVGFAIPALMSVFKAPEFEMLVNFVLQMLIGAITPLVLANVYLSLKDRFEPEVALEGSTAAGGDMSEPSPAPAPDSMSGLESAPEEQAPQFEADKKPENS